MSGEDFSSSAFAYAGQPGLKLKLPSNVRIFRVDILTFDGFLGTKFDILKPRWLPTSGGDGRRCGAVANARRSGTDGVGSSRPMTFQAERRRDLAIQQIERRREDLAARARAAVKRASEEKIEDVEFKELSEPEAPKKVAESEALRMEEGLQAPAAAEEPKASDRTEDAEEHLPSEAGDHGREEAKEPEAPPIAANPEERPPSAERERVLEQAESAEAPNVAEDSEERLPSQENDHATDPNVG